jgi:hypothetical protein
MLCLLLLLLMLLTLALPALAAADASFDALCALLAQAAAGPDQVYALYAQALDTADAVEAGQLAVEAGLPALEAISAQLRAFSPAPLAPPEALVAYMQARGASLEDFQAVGKGAALSAGYYADSVDGYIALWKATPTTIEQCTALNRAGMVFEKQMDFVALNSLLLPTNDTEREAVNRLVVNATAYLSDANLPWDSDMALLLARFDAVAAAYGDMLNEASVAMDAQEAALDGAAQ